MDAASGLFGVVSGVALVAPRHATGQLRAARAAPREVARAHEEQRLQLRKTEASEQGRAHFAVGESRSSGPLQNRYFTELGYQTLAAEPTQ